MPELPEVEIVRRLVVHWLDGRRVVKAEASHTRIFRGAPDKDFVRDFAKDFAALHGRLCALERRGKYLLFTFEQDRGLLAHLGMSGRFVLRPAEETVPYSRARLHLDSGDVLHFADPRLFGRMETCPASRLHALAPIQALGVDPLLEGLSSARLREAVGTSRQQLKVALMDQRRVAGLGNIHAAEGLFRAHLHPARTPTSLTDAEWRRLARGIRAALAYGLKEQQGEQEVRFLKDGAHNGFLVYGRVGTPCPRCGTRVESSTQGGRTTHFCPTCQPRRPDGKSGAPRRKTTARRR